ncbi:biotin--[acetyl-CoA-carboxylase] ligase [Planctomycetaceae bacterium SH139]
MSGIRTAWAGGYAATVQHFSQCDSTNSWAVQHSQQIPAEDLPLLVLADLQTGGRGRAGRSWFADAGTLTFSLLDSAQRLQFSKSQLPRLALITGLAVAEAIEQFIPPVRASLKWPNDVYVAGGKAAGILVESAAGSDHRVVIGVGVNVATDFTTPAIAAADSQLSKRARSLAAIANRPLDRYELLPLILERLDDHLSAFSGADNAQLDNQFAKLVKTIETRCFLTGKEITLQQGPARLRGLCQGIDPSGALRVLVDGQLQQIQSGEVIRVASS